MMEYQPKEAGKARETRNEQYEVELDVHEIAFAEQLLQARYVLEGRYFFDERRDILANIMNETLGFSAGEEDERDFEEPAKVQNDPGNEKVKEEAEKKRGSIRISNDRAESGLDEERFGHFPFRPRAEVALDAPPNIHKSHGEDD